MSSIHEISIPELEILYEKTIKEARKAGEAWANCKAEYESWEDKRKPELARLMGQSEGSQSLKEQCSLSHKDWLAYMEDLSLARRAYLQSQVRYDMAKLKIEAIRSIISTRREEVKNFRG